MFLDGWGNVARQWRAQDDESESLSVFEKATLNESVEKSVLLIRLMEAKGPHTL